MFGAIDPTTLAAAAVFLAVALGTISLVLLGEWTRERTRTRRALRELRVFAKENLDQAADAIIRQTERKRIDLLAARLPAFRDVEHLLVRGKTPWSLSTFILLTAGLALGCALGTYMLWRFLPAAAIAGVLGGAVPYLLARRRARRRMQAFEMRLPDSIDLIGRAIRAGHPLSAGIKMVADEAQEPVAGEFLRVFEEQRFGLAFEDSMFGLVDRVPLVDARILVTAILVQREVGGNLAEILDNLAYVIRERFKIRRQLRVITAQGRMSGYVLAVMPIAVATAIYLLNPSYTRLLFTHPVGKIMLVTAIVLQLCGYYWIRRIIDIEI